MAKQSSSTWATETKLPSVGGAGHQFLNELLSALRKASWNESEIFGIHLAVEEAIVNAIRHGNASDHQKFVHIKCNMDAQRIEIEIVDEGEGFDPDLVSDCTARENWELPSGRGILLMRNYMSRVEYLDGGHRVLMERVRGQAAPAVVPSKKGHRAERKIEPKQVENDC